MTAVSMDSVLRERDLVQASNSDPCLNALRMAILIEDTFDIVLTDDEIDRLQEADSVRQILIERGTGD